MLKHCMLAALLVCSNLAHAHSELKDIFEADQADRKGEVKWAEVGPRDKARHARVGALMAGGAALSSMDYYYAAMVYQHGAEPASYLLAQQWAQRAVELDPNNKPARWLACAAQDRYLFNTGKAQIWGTQFTKRGSGPWT